MSDDRPKPSACSAERVATPDENLRILAARLSEHLSPAEKRELEEAAKALEHYRYADIEHEHFGCHVAKTGIYAESSAPSSEAVATKNAAPLAPGRNPETPLRPSGTGQPAAAASRDDALEEAAKECDALGRMAPNQERGLAYDIAAKCIRDLKGDQ